MINLAVIPEDCPVISPWGLVKSCKEIPPLGNGIYHVSTEEHGGFYVPQKFNKEIPVCHRDCEGWYEELQAYIIPFYYVSVLRRDVPAQTLMERELILINNFS